MAPRTSVPPPGSVKEMAARNRPAAMSGRNRRFCASVPYSPMDLTPAKEVMPQIQASPPRVRDRARARIICISTSPPRPPYSSAIPRPWNPPSVNLSQSAKG